MKKLLAVIILILSTTFLRSEIVEVSKTEYIITEGGQNYKVVETVYLDTDSNETSNEIEIVEIVVAQ